MTTEKRQQGVVRRNAGDARGQGRRHPRLREGLGGRARTSRSRSSAAPARAARSPSATATSTSSTTSATASSARGF